MKTSGIKKIPFEVFAVNKFHSPKDSYYSGEFDKHLGNSQISNVNEQGYQLNVQTAATNVNIGKEKLVSKNKAIETYKLSMSDQIKMYVQDQLLSNPGGDQYDLEEPDGQAKNVSNNWQSAIKKDISDAIKNIRNFFLDLTIGAPFKYIDSNGKIQTGRKRGLLQSIASFFKNIVSGLTFGLYTPGNQKPPKILSGRIKHFFKSFYRAIFSDAIEGVGGSINHAAEDLVFGAWNSIEAISDATIGTTSVGRRVTSKIFDNGQVILDYATDVIPGGEAWFRVHDGNILKGEFPIITNLQKPIKSEAHRWAYVRNTPFRKAIETIGSLMSDIFYFIFVGRNSITGGDSRDKK